MNRHSIRPHVEKLFARGAARTTRVAIEQEFFALGMLPGCSVGPDRIRDAVAGRPFAAWVSFEPGGQVELSLPPAADATAAGAHLRQVTGQLAAALARHSVALTSRPVRACDPNTPRYLRTPRYDAMEAHLDTVGTAGRRMMRATASTQVCLDWWSGREGWEQWRVLLLAAPFLAAATARSTGATSRLATWLEVDPSRTAFDASLVRTTDPVADYVDFAVGAVPFVDGDAAHLTTLFPPVRPRGSYLEVRFADAQPTTEVGALAAGLAGLLYDADHRRAALASLAPEEGRLAEHWQATARGDGDVERGLALLMPTRRIAQAA